MNKILLLILFSGSIVSASAAKKSPESTSEMQEQKTTEKKDLAKLYVSLSESKVQESLDLIKILPSKALNKLVAFPSGVPNGADITTTAMHVAARNNLLPVLEYLLNEDNTVVNFTDSSNRLTPLHEATKRPSKEIILLLLENNADKTALNKYNNTPFKYGLSHIEHKLNVTLEKYNPRFRDKELKEDQTSYDKARKNI